MRKADHQFFDDLALTDRPRDAGHLHVWRKELAHKMIAIKCSYAITPNASSHGRHVIEMWIIAHRGHGCVKVTGELGIHVLLKQIDHLLRCHQIPPRAPRASPSRRNACQSFSCRQRTLPGERRGSVLVNAPEDSEELLLIEPAKCLPRQSATRDT